MWPVMVYSGVAFAVMPAWAHVWFGGPAVYLLCRRELSGRITILSIDETADLADAIGAGDAGWDQALRLGMTEVHAHFLAGGPDARRALAGRLRRRYATPLNRENPVHRDLALLAEALAPRAAPAMTIFDLFEALLVNAEQPGSARPAPIRPRAATQPVIASVA